MQAYMKLLNIIIVFVSKHNHIIIHEQNFNIITLLCTLIQCLMYIIRESCTSFKFKFKYMYMYVVMSSKYHIV